MQIRRAPWIVVLTLALAALATTTRAEPPPPPETWRPMTAVVGCNVDTEDTDGYCRLFQDLADQRIYLVFWDGPPSNEPLKWIRYGTDGDYTYTYQRALVPAGIAL